MTKNPKQSILTSFWKSEACNWILLPDRSILIGQVLLENAQIKKSNTTFWVIFKQYALFSSTRNFKIEKSKLFDFGHPNISDYFSDYSTNLASLIKQIGFGLRNLEDPPTSQVIQAGGLFNDRSNIP